MMNNVTLLTTNDDEAAVAASEKKGTDYYVPGRNPSHIRHRHSVDIAVRPLLFARCQPLD